MLSALLSFIPGATALPFQRFRNRDRRNGVVICSQYGPRVKRWANYFSELKAYKAEHGTVRVGRKDNAGLYKWCIKQRTQWSRGELELEKFRALSSISFCWDLKEEAFRMMFYRLVDFRNEHGHCNVPHDGDSQLARWCVKQRYLKNAGLLSDERRRRLLGLGFEFDPFARRFNENLDELRTWLEERGQEPIPRETRLGSFVDRVRQRWKKGKLDARTYRELRELGFCFEIRLESWEGYLARLGKFRRDNGHVMPLFVKDRSMYLWINMQRQRYRDGTLCLQHRVQLEALGIDFRPRSVVVDERISELARFYEEHGVVEPTETDRRLYEVVNYLRDAGRKGVGKRRAARLDKIGFCFEMAKQTVHV